MTASLRCKVCGDGSALYCFKAGFAVHRCESCGFGQAIVPADQVAEIYGKEYFSGEIARFRQSAGEVIDVGQAWWVDKYVPASVASVIEVGPGPAARVGKYLRSTRAGLKYHAVEISAFASEVLRLEGFEVCVGRVCDRAIISSP